MDLGLDDLDALADTIEKADFDYESILNAIGKPIVFFFF
jgi:hypothetical protein